ncbi:hypothetical protein [Sinomicrobium sp. M5D2P9]
MKKILFILLLTVLFGSCKDIEITKEYIKNDYWDDHNNAIQINKMKVIDSTLNVLDPDFEIEPNHSNIVNKIEMDSSFYASYAGLNAFALNKPKLKGKIYFNKDNGWKWSFNGQKKEIIGELENDTWYKFSRLTNDAYYLYVYIDSTGIAHKYGVNLANY